MFFAILRTVRCQLTSTSRDLLNTPIAIEAVGPDSPTDSPPMCPSDSLTNTTTDNVHLNGLSGGQSVRVNTT
jgi:hypothetical protein